jgi:hypothetical protein
VGGMPPEQLIRFQRDEEGRVERIEVTPEMTMGRADQVLTSQLFGMSTTLDTVTQELSEQYTKLLGKNHRTETEEIEYKKLRDQLLFRIPLSPETPMGRMAAALIEEVTASIAHGKSTVASSKALLKKAEELVKEASFHTGKDK